MGAINVGIAVLAQILPGQHVAWSGFLAFTLLVAAIGALLLILWPRLKWAHGLDPEVLCKHHLRVDVGDEQVLESLFGSLVKQGAKNDDEFKKLYLYYRAAIGLLFLGTIFVIWQAGTWSK